MSYLTESKLANTLDVPVALPTTEIKMGDWVVIATQRLFAGQKLTYRMMNFNFVSTTFDLTKITAANLIIPNFGMCYVGLYLNYVSGDPGVLTGLDVVSATATGVVNRSGNPFITSTAGTYSWIAVNNVTYSANNALLTPNDSADFKLCATGQCRVELTQ